MNTNDRLRNLHPLWNQTESVAKDLPSALVARRQRRHGTASDLRIGNSVVARWQMPSSSVDQTARPNTEQL